MKLNLLIVICILSLLISGCSNTSSNSTDTAKQDQVSESFEDQASDWSCESSQDELGEVFFCRTRYIDDEEIYWTLVLMCTSDLQTKHSVSGLRYPSGASVLWPTENTARIRIDSGQIEEILTKSKGSGAGFTFSKSTKLSENSDTWYLMSRIASAQTFGFKAYDIDGQPGSALFQVAGSVPIAAKFSVMGCKNS